MKSYAGNEPRIDKIEDVICEQTPNHVFYFAMNSETHCGPVIYQPFDRMKRNAYNSSSYAGCNTKENDREWRVGKRNF